jgi:hypothetical protein
MDVQNAATLIGTYVFEKNSKERNHALIIAQKFFCIHQSPIFQLRAFWCTATLMQIRDRVVARDKDMNEFFAEAQHLRQKWQATQDPSE